MQLLLIPGDGIKAGNRRAEKLLEADILLSAAGASAILKISVYTWRKTDRRVPGKYYKTNVIPFTPSATATGRVSVHEPARRPSFVISQHTKKAIQNQPEALDYGNVPLHLLLHPEIASAAVTGKAGKEGRQK